MVKKVMKKKEEWLMRKKEYEADARTLEEIINEILGININWN